ncbi:MAG: DUF502 domain-containing protein [Verrucomicrobiae bacterium]|nr:DUF502 domain-containing protein [Verrucomicrobiae bacterium]NNJ86537.1 DUF502 domain-containing protein [Akkermansiaceae bacterium]
MNDDNPLISGIGEPKPSKHPRIRRVMGLLLTGLAAVVPIVGTIWLLVVIYKVLMRVGDELIKLSLKGLNLMRSGEDLVSSDFAFYGSNFVRFLIPVFLLLLIGFAVANRPGRKILFWLNEGMQRVPYLGFIYSALKQFVDAVKNLGGDRKFKSVAYVEYPSPGCRLLGFVTGNYHDPQTGEDVTTVFIPTSPNPMTGFTVIVEDDKVQDSSMTLEEASKMNLSAGLVAPASFRQDD